MNLRIFLLHCILLQLYKIYAIYSCGKFIFIVDLLFIFCVTSICKASQPRYEFCIYTSLVVHVSQYISGNGCNISYASARLNFWYRIIYCPINTFFSQIGSFWQKMYFENTPYKCDLAPFFFKFTLVHTLFLILIVV